MRSVLVSAIALTTLGLASPGVSADLPLRGSVLPPVAPIYSWSGYYVGGNIGYSWGKEDLNVSGFTVNGVPVPGGDPAALRPNGVIGGAQAGFNWQTGSVVVGIEGDIQWTDQKDSITSAGAFSGSAFSTFDCFGDVDWPCTVTGTAANTLATKINWFGTLRARFGIAADQFLFYGTGGFAYGRVRTSGVASFSGTYTDTGGPCDPSGPGACSASGSAAFADSATRLGWAAGAGIEACMPFIGNWTWRIEYLFVDLGTINTTTAYSSSFVVGALLPPLFAQTAYQSLTHSARVTDNIVRFGLNYRFGGGMPVVASY